MLVNWLIEREIGRLRDRETRGQRDKGTRRNGDTEKDKDTERQRY